MSIDKVDRDIDLRFMSNTEADIYIFIYMYVPTFLICIRHDISEELSSD